MSWTDKIAIENILKLRDEFNINTAVETGTFRGVNAELYAHHFQHVFSMDTAPEYLEIAKRRLQGHDNAKLYEMSSVAFLHKFRNMYFRQRRKDSIFIYLDAHFYDPSLPPEHKWIVVNELKALRGFRNCVLCIHDFDCAGLGHLCYDGEHLGWNVIGDHIVQVNPDFHYYTNTKEWCDIYNEETIKELPITIDDDIRDSMRFVNSSDEKRYRGILYAVPRELDLSKYRLKKYERALL